MDTLYNFQDDNIELKGYIDKKSILKYVTEEEIFESVLGYTPQELDYICSPLRQDNNPGAFFNRGIHTNRLLFVDWADPYESIYDCFAFIQRYHKLPNFYSTLQFVADTLINGKTIVRDNSASEIVPVKKEIKKVEIHIEPRPFNHTDGIYWGKYGITKRNLIEDKVFAVGRVLLKNSRRGNREVPLYTKCFAYTDFQEGRKKLYFPYSKGRNRFLSTCTKEDIMVKHLKDVSQIMITKSYKDYRVLRNLGINVTWFQNEGTVPNNLKEIIRDYKEVIIFFDNDSTGLSASEKLVNIIGKRAREIYLPIPLLEEGIKDASDMYLKKGVDELKLFLTRSKINLYEAIRKSK